MTHNYVVVEASTLVHTRLGGSAMRDLHDALLAAVRLVWVDESLHRAGVAALLAARGRRVSLVDWVSFELMRRQRVQRAFAFDRDFADQGFALVP